MARLLLDSNVFLWWSASRKLLPPDIIRTIAEAEQPAISIVTPWELELKRNLGKVNLPKRLWDFLDEDGFTIVGIGLADALAAAQLPLHHRDPFDRMMIAQAIRRDLTIITRDGKFAAYGVSVMMV
jgi:PIN domain nuclease of toxin-antitoxin system